MPDLLTIAFIALASLGVALFWRGWRGQRIDNHPWCRKCRFDLKGLWPGAARCPECGIDLERIDAVELGQRERRPICTVIGALLLLVCIAWLGLGTWRSTSNIKWAQYKPDWWLHREALSADAGKREAALAALAPRAEKGELNEARLLSLVEHALTLQADESAAWSPAWGNMVVYAWREGLLTPEQIDQFARGAITLSLSTGSGLVRRWDLATLTAQPAVLRSSQADLTVTLTPIECTLGGSALPIDSTPSRNLRFGGNTRLSGQSLTIPILVEAGEYKVESTWSLAVMPRNSTARPASWEVRATAPLRVLPETEGAPELIVGPEADQALRDCFRFEAVGLRLSQSGPLSAARSASITLVVGAVDTPFSAWLRLRAQPLGGGGDM